jgi:hypothetical protein
MLRIGRAADRGKTLAVFIAKISAPGATIRSLIIARRAVGERVAWEWQVGATSSNWDLPDE